MQSAFPKKTTLQARKTAQADSRDCFFLALLNANFEWRGDIMRTSEGPVRRGWLEFRGGFSAGGGQWRGVSRKNSSKTPLNYIEADNRQNLTRKINFL